MQSDLPLCLRYRQAHDQLCFPEPNNWSKQVDKYATALKSSTLAVNV